MEKPHNGSKIYANLFTQGIELRHSCFRAKNFRLPTSHNTNYVS